MSTSDRDDDAGRPPSAPRDEAAVAVETFVVERSGRWEVDIVVMFPSGAERRTINHYRTRRHAEIAASWTKRAAQRDIPGPLGGW